MQNHNKYLHFRPSYETPLIAGDLYYDISNSDLCIWEISTMRLHRCYPKLTDGFLIKLRWLSLNRLLIVDNDKIKVFDLQLEKVVSSVQIEDLIEYVQTQPELGFVACVTAGSDQYTKTVHKWQINKESEVIYKGKLEVKFNSEIEPETEFLLNIFRSGRIYLLRKQDQQIFEVKVESSESLLNKIQRNTTALLELHKNNKYAVASNGKIEIIDPTKVAKYGYIECQGEIYNTILELEGKDILITASNKGVKSWALESKSQPKLFVKSQSLNIDRLIVQGNTLIGMSLKGKSIAIWNLQTYQLIKLEKILKLELQKIVRLSEKLLCLVSKVFDETEEQLSYHHRMQIVDVDIDMVVAFKEVKKSTFQIEVGSLIAIDPETIRFICFSDNTQKPKSYLFTWRPFTKQQKKEITKIEMSKTAITKLYKFDRIVFGNPPKQNKQPYSKQQSFSLFHKNENKTTITINTHALKKVAQIVLEGSYDDIELSEDNRVYLLNKERVDVFKITAGGLVKQLSAEISLTGLYFTNKHILGLTSSEEAVLYDTKMEMIFKNSDQEYPSKVIKVIELSKNEFSVLFSNGSIELWNIDKETTKRVQLDSEVCDMEIMNLKEVYLLQSNRIQLFDILSVFK